MREGLNITELLNFNDKLISLAEKQMPKEIPKLMKRSAKRGKEIMAKNARMKYVFSTFREDGKSYHKGWRSGKIVYEYEDYKYNVRIYNVAPHFHLVERGHRMVTKDGKEVGYVKGKEVMEKSKSEVERDYVKTMTRGYNKMIDKLRW